jgi:hypothetical protein
MPESQQSVLAATEIENLIGIARNGYCNPDAADASLKAKVLRLLLNLVDMTAKNPALRDRWALSHGIEYCEGERGAAPSACLWLEDPEEGTYKAYFSLRTNKSRTPRDYDNHAQIHLGFTKEELAPFFAQIDSTGLASFLARQKLIQESARLLRFEEALDAFTPAITD